MGLYIHALAADPGAYGARAALRRTRPPLPTSAAQSEVVARLELGAGCENGASTSASGPRPAVISRVTVRMPAGDRDIRAMRLDRERGAGFRDARNRLIHRVGLPEPDQRLTRFGYNVQDRAGTVELAVHNSVGEVTFQLGGVICERRLQEAWPWIIKSADQGVIVRPVLRRSPPGSKKRVEVVSCVWKPVIATPSPPSDSAPSEGGRSTLAWDLEARRISSRPQVTLEIPLLDRWSLAGSGLAATVRFIASMLVPGALLLLVFRRLPSSPARPRVAAALVGLIFLAIAASMVVLYGYSPIRGVRGTIVGVLPVLLLLGLYWAVAPPASVLGRFVSLIASVPALGVVLWRAWGPDSAALNPPRGVVLALAIVLVALMAFVLLMSALHAFAAGFGSPVAGWRRRLA